MATTRIMPLYVNKGKTAKQSLKERLDYVLNPDKTDNYCYVKGFKCDPEIAVSQFVSYRNIYKYRTERDYDGDILAYHLRQSFKPGEISPDEANASGYELASRLLKGKYAFLVCTHTDKEHIHNHIMICPYSFDGKTKFKRAKINESKLELCERYRRLNPVQLEPVDFIGINAPEQERIFAVNKKSVETNDSEQIESGVVKNECIEADIQNQVLDNIVETSTDISADSSADVPESRGSAYEIGLPEEIAALVQEKIDGFEKLQKTERVKVLQDASTNLVEKYRKILYKYTVEGFAHDLEKLNAYSLRDAVNNFRN